MTNMGEIFASSKGIFKDFKTTGSAVGDLGGRIDFREFFGFCL